MSKTTATAILALAFVLSLVTPSAEGWALEIKPDYCKARLHMGITRELQGEHEEAVRHLKQALICDPDSADAHFYLGQILAVVGQSADATRHLLEAQRLRPEWSAPVDAMAVIHATRPAASDRERGRE